MKCLKCGWSNSDTAAYCQKCHAYLAEQPGMESIDAIKALILSLFFTGIFYLVFPIPVIRSEYWLQLFSGHISETIVALVLWSLFLIFFKWRQFRQQFRAYGLSGIRSCTTLYQKAFMSGMWTRGYWKSVSLCRSKK